MLEFPLTFIQPTATLSANNFCTVKYIKNIWIMEWMALATYNIILSVFTLFLTPMNDMIPGLNKTR